MIPLSDIGVVAIEFENTNESITVLQKSRVWFADGSSHRLKMEPIYSADDGRGVELIAALGPTLINGVNRAGAEALHGFADWTHNNHLVLSVNPERKGLWQFARRGENNNGRLVPHPDAKANENQPVRGIEYTTQTMAPALSFIASCMAETLIARMGEEQRSSLAPVIREQKARALRQDIESGFPEHLRGKALAAVEQMELRELIASKKRDDATPDSAFEALSFTAPVARRAKVL